MMLSHLEKSNFIERCKNFQMAVKANKMSHYGLHFTVFNQNNSFFLLEIT